MEFYRLIAIFIKDILKNIYYFLNKFIVELKNFKNYGNNSPFFMFLSFKY
jgi:hypothetical protein